MAWPNSAYDRRGDGRWTSQVVGLGEGSKKKPVEVRHDLLGQPPVHHIDWSHGKPVVQPLLLVLVSQERDLVRETERGGCIVRGGFFTKKIIIFREGFCTTPSPGPVTGTTSQVTR